MPTGKTLLIATPTQINTQSFTYYSKQSTNHYSIYREGRTLIATRKTKEKRVEKTAILGQGSLDPRI